MVPIAHRHILLLLSSFTIPVLPHPPKHSNPLPPPPTQHHHSPIARPSTMVLITLRHIVTLVPLATSFLSSFVILIIVITVRHLRGVALVAVFAVFYGLDVVQLGQVLVAKLLPVLLRT